MAFYVCLLYVNDSAVQCSAALTAFVVSGKSSAALDRTVRGEKIRADRMMCMRNESILISMARFMLLVLS